jgi:hypothetical protein
MEWRKSKDSQGRCTGHPFTFAAVFWPVSRKNDGRLILEMRPRALCPVFFQAMARADDRPKAFPSPDLAAVFSTGCIQIQPMLSSPYPM